MFSFPKDRPSLDEINQVKQYKLWLNSLEPQRLLPGMTIYPKISLFTQACPYPYDTVKVAIYTRWLESLECHASIRGTPCGMPINPKAMDLQSDVDPHKILCLTHFLHPKKK
jgi:hypothetical protein